jgi:hypothetical protein
MNGTAVGPRRDYCEVLGVDGKGVTAFRRPARRCHPDVSTERDARERFKEIAGAYEITVKILKGIPGGTVLRPPGLPHYGARPQRPERQPGRERLPAAVQTAAPTLRSAVRRRNRPARRARRGASGP